MPLEMPGDDGIHLCVDHKLSWPHVFVRCLQNMLGVIIFVRIAWITEQVGLGMTIFFIALGFVVSFITTMSVAAIATDQRVGFFATVSTYTSSAVAAGVSVLYVMSNVIAFATFIVALTETLVNFLRNSGFTMVDGSVNDMRIFSAVFCILVLLAAVIRPSDYFRFRIVMLLLVLAAVLMQIIGLMVPSLIMEKRMNSTTFKISDYNPYDEKSMGFVVYFPAVTCIFVGLTIRGNFRRKKNNVFRGSSLALVLSSLLYILTAVLEAHFSAVSHLVLDHITDPHHKLHATAVLKSLPVTLIILLSCFYCAYTAFINAAHTVQAVGKSNGLVPGWDKLGRGYGTENSPRIAFVVITVVGILLTMIGEFNIIASIMTIYYLSTFAILNYAVFMATLK
ncbi:Amino acid permease [Trichostrongylus colubriformis]|uniref:Amino acid permease n=1 Tax=Trichostrongylus colubriformis TaxID=6319 RepID=A0AAN8FPS3_TRICO